MQHTDFLALNVPDSPGVYFFINNKKKILYIGKATSLKNRLKSYFAKNIREVRSPLIEVMVNESEAIEFTPTESVLEALILETNLIRTNKPKYNTRSKDDKSYNHLIITNEKWPRLLMVRGKELAETFKPGDVAHCFGPFTSGLLLREALKIVRKLFRFYDTKQPVGAERSKVTRGVIDFNRQIGLYPDSADPAAYAKTIRHLRLFFEGKKAKIIKELEKEMLSLAKSEHFEAANIIKKQIFALKHIEDIALIKHDRIANTEGASYRIEAFDVAHLGGKNMVGVMTVVVDGEAKPGEYRKFTIKSLSDANDPAALKEILRRRLAHPEWPFPNLIVVDGNNVQQKTAEFVVRESGLLIPIVAVTKNLKHKPERIIAPKEILTRHEMSILLANAEAHRFAIGFYRQKSRKNALR